MTHPKILTLDIETAPLKSYHWSLWKQNIGLNQIGDEWSILSYSAKWLGERAVIYSDVSGQDNLRDDARLCQELWDLLDEADFVVGQNAKKFDVKKIKARMVMHRMLPFSPVVVIDTMLIAKDVFNFTSNKLEWMTTHLTTKKKLKHQKFPGFELWAECLNDNPLAWAEMKAYNIADTVSTEELYLALRPWAEGHPNLAAFYNDEKLRCPRCASTKLTPTSFAYTTAGKYQRYKCQCGGFARSRYTLNTLGKRRAMLSN